MTHGRKLRNVFLGLILKGWEQICTHFSILQHLFSWERYQNSGSGKEPILPKRILLVWTPHTPTCFHKALVCYLNGNHTGRYDRQNKDEKGTLWFWSLTPFSWPVSLLGQKTRRGLLRNSILCRCSTFICWVRWDQKILYAPDRTASITQLRIFRTVRSFFHPDLYQSQETNQVIQRVMSPIVLYNSIPAILHPFPTLGFLLLCSLIIASVIIKTLCVLENLSESFLYLLLRLIPWGMSSCEVLHLNATLLNSLLLLHLKENQQQFLLFTIIHFLLHKNIHLWISWHRYGFYQNRGKGKARTWTWMHMVGWMYKGCL